MRFWNACFFYYQISPIRPLIYTKTIFANGGEFTEIFAVEVAGNAAESGLSGLAPCLSGVIDTVESLMTLLCQIFKLQKARRHN